MVVLCRQPSSFQFSELERFSSFISRFIFSRSPPEANAGGGHELRRFGPVPAPRPRAGNYGESRRRGPRHRSTSRGSWRRPHRKAFLVHPTPYTLLPR